MALKSIAARIWLLSSCPVLSCLVCCRSVHYMPAVKPQGTWSGCAFARQMTSLFKHAKPCRHTLEVPTSDLVTSAQHFRGFTQILLNSCIETDTYSTAKCTAYPQQGLSRPMFHFAIVDSYFAATRPAVWLLLLHHLCGRIPVAQACSPVHVLHFLNFPNLACMLT